MVCIGVALTEKLQQYVNTLLVFKSRESNEFAVLQKLNLFVELFCSQTHTSTHFMAVFYLYYYKYIHC